MITQGSQSCLETHLFSNLLPVSAVNQLLPSDVNQFPFAFRSVPEVLFKCGTLHGPHLGAVALPATFVLPALSDQEAGGGGSEEGQRESRRAACEPSCLSIRLEVEVVPACDACGWLPKADPVPLPTDGHWPKRLRILG